jgi:hypothetical protein
MLYLYLCVGNTCVYECVLLVCIDGMQRRHGISQLPVTVKGGEEGREEGTRRVFTRRIQQGLLQLHTQSDSTTRDRQREASVIRTTH